MFLVGTALNSFVYYYWKKKKEGKISASHACALYCLLSMFWDVRFNINQCRKYVGMRLLCLCYSLLEHHNLYLSFPIPWHQICLIQVSNIWLLLGIQLLRVIWGFYSSSFWLMCIFQMLTVSLNNLDENCTMNKTWLRHELQQLKNWHIGENGKKISFMCHIFSGLTHGDKFCSCTS